MDEINSPNPAAVPTWRERAAALWARLNAQWERARQKVILWKISGDRSAVFAIVVPAFIVAGAVWILVTLWPASAEAPPEPVVDVELLQTRVDELEDRVDRLTPAESPAPDPVPARPGVPRAAVRPTPPPATKPATAPGVIAWEPITDFDGAVSANR